MRSRSSSAQRSYAGPRGAGRPRRRAARPSSRRDRAPRASWWSPARGSAAITARGWRRRSGPASPRVLVARRRGDEDAADGRAHPRRAPRRGPRPRRRRARPRRRRGRRHGRLRRRHLHARGGVGAAAHHPAGHGRRVHRRQGRRQPPGGQEPRGRLPPAARGGRRPRHAGHPAAAPAAQRRLRDPEVRPHRRSRALRRARLRPRRASRAGRGSEDAVAARLRDQGRGGGRRRDGVRPAPRAEPRPHRRPRAGDRHRLPPVHARRGGGLGPRRRRPGSPPRAGCWTDGTRDAIVGRAWTASAPGPRWPTSTQERCWPRSRTTRRRLRAACASSSPPPWARSAVVPDVATDEIRAALRRLGLGASRPSR